MNEKDLKNTKYTVIEKLKQLLDKKDPETPATQAEIDQLKKEIEREELKAKLNTLKQNNKGSGLAKAMKLLRENLSDPKDVHL